MEPIKDAIKNTTPYERTLLTRIVGDFPFAKLEQLPEERVRESFTITLRDWDDDPDNPISAERVIGIVKAISADGFDTAGYVLDDIPEPHTFCFYNERTGERFDYAADDDKTFYPMYSVHCPGTYALDMKVAASIEEAVANYEPFD